MLGLQTAHRLGMLEAFGQGIDEDRVQPVDAIAVVMQQGLGAAGVVGHVILRGRRGRKEAAKRGQKHLSGLCPFCARFDVDGIFMGS